MGLSDIKKLPYLDILIYIPAANIIKHLLDRPLVANQCVCPLVILRGFPSRGQPHKAPPKFPERKKEREGFTHLSQPNTNFMPVGPIGMSYVLGNLDRKKHQIKALEMAFQENPQKAIRDTILEFQSEIIGLSVGKFDELDMASRTCYFPKLKEVAKVIRENNRAPIVLRGVSFTVMPKQLMVYLEADLRVVGEGERAFPELLDELQTGKDYKDLAGLIFKENGGFRINKPDRIEDLDEINLPDRSFMDLTQYVQNNGFIGVISKQGVVPRLYLVSIPLLLREKGSLKKPR